MTVTMIRVVALLATLFCAAPPALASMTVFGTGDSALCAQAAKLAKAMMSDLAVCDRALEEEALSRRDRAATHVNRGILLTHRKRYEAALEDFARAQRLMPDLPEAFVGRGNVRFLQRDYAAALADYQAAIDRDIEDMLAARFNRGIAYEALKRYEEALADYLYVSGEAPDWALVQEKLELYRRAGVLTDNGS